VKLPAYARTKPSGVEWLGDVPEHWEVNRLRWVGEAIIGLTYSPTDVVSVSDGTLVLRSSNIQGGRIVLDDNVFVSAEIPQKLRTKANDIVICTRNGSRDLVGKTGKISERESGLTFGAFTAVFRSPANDYMFYVFNSGLFSFQAGLYQTSTIFQLTNGTINAFQIPLPPAAEQRAITAFLDRETGRVDRLAAKKRELIERLKEKRTALISRTVTRGLPPAAARTAGLPANPPLKPSALDWLGDIPIHWGMKQLKWAIMFQRGHDLPTDEREEGEVPLVTSAGVTASHSRAAAKGPGIVTGRYGTIGEFYLVDRDYWPLNTTLYSISLRGNDPKFLIYLLRHLSPLFLLNAVKSAVPGVDRNDIHSTMTAVPPPPEQAAIAAYLDKETAKLDALVGKVEEAVERLQEYRTALITAAVTGKIDVRPRRRDSKSG
jgi:type I restriction enzyme S subunit